MNGERQTLTGAVDSVAARLATPSLYPANVQAPGEEVVVFYTVGTGRFSGTESPLYLELSGTIYELNGRETGHWEGVYEIVAPTGEWGVRPPTLPPFDEPAPPVEHLPPQVFTKATWNFGRDSSITAVGWARVYRTAYLQGWESKATQFWLSSNQQITEGATGRFAGARGLKTQSLSIYVPPGKEFPAAGEFPVKTTETFRITLGEQIGEAPGG